MSTLLPVIRFNSEARSSMFSSRPSTLAIYVDEVVIFTERPGYIFPEEAYTPAGADTLVRARCCRNPVRIPLGDITAATLDHPKFFSTTKGRIATARRAYSFALPVRECAHVETALRELLGDRLKVTGTIKVAAGPAAAGQAARPAAPKPPVYSKPQARRLRWLAVPLFLVLSAIGVAVTVLFLQEYDWAPWVVIGSIGLGAFLGYLCVERAYHLGLTPAVELLATDPRPPVLYLRSFRDDGKNNLHPISQTADLFGLKNPRSDYYASVSGAPNFLPLLKIFCLMLRLGWLVNLFRGIRNNTAEEQFSAFFSTLGPFIAIGRPGEKLAQGGAARLYVGHDEWQRKVAELVPRCSIILLQPEETEGVWWEIFHAVERVPPEKILLCLVNYAGNQQRYEEFRLKFESMTRITLPRMIGRYMFLYFTAKREPRMLELRYHSEFTWPWRGQAVNFPQTLAPFFDRTQSQPFSEKDRRFRGHGWLAVPAYFVLSLLLLIGPIVILALLTGK